MSDTICAFHNEGWRRHGLQDFGDFADLITECNVGEDSFSGFGDWFFIPADPLPSGNRVIYFGSWGNDNSPGASMYTQAEIFDMKDTKDAARYAKRVTKWESQPEFIGETE